MEKEVEEATQAAALRDSHLRAVMESVYITPPDTPSGRGHGARAAGAGVEQAQQGGQAHHQQRPVAQTTAVTPPPPRILPPQYLPVVGSAETVPARNLGTAPARNSDTAPASQIQVGVSHPPAVPKLNLGALSLKVGTRSCAGASLLSTKWRARARAVCLSVCLCRSVSASVSLILPRTRPSTTRITHLEAHQQSQEPAALIDFGALASAFQNTANEYLSPPKLPSAPAPAPSSEFKATAPPALRHAADSLSLRAPDPTPPAGQQQTNWATIFVSEDDLLSLSESTAPWARRGPSFASTQVEQQQQQHQQQGQASLPVVPEASHLSGRGNGGGAAGGAYDGGGGGEPRVQAQPLRRRAFTPMPPPSRSSGTRAIPSAAQAMEAGASSCRPAVSRPSSVGAWLAIGPDGNDGNDGGLVPNGGDSAAATGRATHEAREAGSGSAGGAGAGAGTCKPSPWVAPQSAPASASPPKPPPKNMKDWADRTETFAVRHRASRRFCHCVLPTHTHKRTHTHRQMHAHAHVERHARTHLRAHTRTLHTHSHPLIHVRKLTS